MSGRTGELRRERLSVLVPVHDEERCLAHLYERVTRVAQALPVELELVFVDDGSTDASRAILDALAERDERVAIVGLSRRFGKEAAVTAGLAAASGDAVVILDADLQDPPECLPAMVDAWHAGHDVVAMRRVDRRSDSWWKRRFAALFYRMLGALSDTPVPADVGDFRLMSRRVVDALEGLPERTRCMKGLFAWVGFPTVTLDYARAARHAGRSAWSTLRLVGLAIDGITSFSIVPLRIATALGALAALLALGFGGVTVARALLFGDPVAGFPTLIAIITFLGGLQLLATGVLGEYVGRTYLESKRRPLYLIEFHRPSGSGTRRRGANPQATVERIKSA